MKRAQVLLYSTFLCGGIGIFVASFLVSGERQGDNYPKYIPRASLLALSAVLFVAFIAMKLTVRHRRQKAMTTEILADIAKYDAEWQQLLRVQGGDLAAVETLLSDRRAADRVTRRGTRLPRPSSVSLQSRETRDQLIIMITQAWEVNDKFQQLSFEWQAHCKVAGTGGEEGEKGLLPKRRARAIEKVWRTYDGDASRLRDLVRCSLVPPNFLVWSHACCYIIQNHPTNTHQSHAVSYHVLS
jgi:hypothetical protein